MTFELIETYHEIAIDTVKRLREEHKSELRRQNGTEWRKKMRGFKINQDLDMMDEDEPEGADDIESLDLESRTSLQDLERWEQEARTWDLLRRMTTLQHGAAPSIELPPIHRYSSEREIWDSFLKMDGLGLERNTVLSWLKETANESEEDIDVLVQDLQQNAERGDIIAHGWLHTKSAIKHQKRTHAWPYVLDSSSPAVKKVLLNSSKTEPLVTQLDPDAPTRQGLKLEAQDEYFERAIWRGCYELLRRGKSMDEIREWCGDRTEIWRAVSMSGLPDNNQESNESGDLNYASKALWRRMCYALAKRDGGDPYERAVYGILSGDFWSVDPVCRNWNDNLFAHYNALVRSQYEAFVQTHYPHRAPADVVKAHPVFDAVQFHGEPGTANSRIVDLLNLKPSLEAESKEPLKVLQSVLIAKTFRDFICQQGLALSKWANQDTRSNIITKLSIDPDNEDKVAYIRGDDYETLRVLAHILIAFKSFGMDLGDELDTYAIENIIVAYISFLKLAGKEDLIPLYAAQLSEDRCYATLGRELLDVTTHEGRHTQIKLMRDLGLDVQRFVKSQTYFLMQDYPDKSEGYPALGNFHILEGDSSRQHLCRKIKPDYLGNTVITPQKLMIRSLEWYLYVEGMWSETLQTGTMLYKRFYSKSPILSML
jgi:nuclear pore complex protein Nup107